MSNDGQPRDKDQFRLAKGFLAIDQAASIMTIG